MAELTPMMKQYMETKFQYQDCILFYRLGDFYEMFFDDGAYRIPGTGDYADRKELRTGGEGTHVRCPLSMLWRAISISSSPKATK